MVMYVLTRAVGIQYSIFKLQELSVCSACMGGCVLEENFQVCLFTSFMTQLSQ